VDGLSFLDPVALALTALGICVLALLVLLIVMVRQSRLINRYRHLLQGDSTRNLDEVLRDQAADLAALKGAVSGVERRIEELARASETHAQRMGVIRFNAFPDAGSDLSFAIALLDAHNNGFVISSLYGRNESRTYAKPIRAGTSTYALSEEEKAALSQAMGKTAQ